MHSKCPKASWWFQLVSCRLIVLDVRLDMHQACADVVAQRICPACRVGQMQYVGCHQLEIRESTWTKPGHKTSAIEWLLACALRCHAEHPLMNMMYHFAFECRLCSGEIVVKNNQKYAHASIWILFLSAKGPIHVLISSICNPAGHIKSHKLDILSKPWLSGPMLQKAD